MNSNKTYHYPPIYMRIISVWYRFVKVYSKNLISNGLPPFLEPLIFLIGIGLGLGGYIKEMQGVPYVKFLASGIMMTAAMFTSAFECSVGTFIRLEFDKVYDGILSAPISVNNLLVGEIVWAGTKGFAFSFPVMIIVACFNIIPITQSYIAPFLGFLTGAMFAAISLFITSFVKTINHFSFYFTGFISPMIFFSGTVFPLERLPKVIRPLAEVMPLTHSVRIVRSFIFHEFSIVLLYDFIYIILFLFIFGFLAIKKLKKRLVD